MSTVGAVPKREAMEIIPKQVQKISPNASGTGSNQGNYSKQAEKFRSGMMESMSAMHIGDCHFSTFQIMRTIFFSWETVDWFLQK